MTPHASFLALDVAPQEAYANIQTLRRLYPGVYGADGFFDAVNPTTGAVGHRYLVLDQSMIMAALDNALNNRAMQHALRRRPGVLGGSNLPRHREQWRSASPARHAARGHPMNRDPFAYVSFAGKMTAGTPAAETETRMISGERSTAFPSRRASGRSPAAGAARALRLRRRRDLPGDGQADGDRQRCGHDRADYGHELDDAREDADEQPVGQAYAQNTSESTVPTSRIRIS